MLAWHKRGPCTLFDARCFEGTSNPAQAPLANAPPHPGTLHLVRHGGGGAGRALAERHLCPKLRSCLSAQGARRLLVAAVRRGGCERGSPGVCVTEAAVAAAAAATGPVEAATLCSHFKVETPLRRGTLALDGREAPLEHSPPGPTLARSRMPHPSRHGTAPLWLEGSQLPLPTPWSSGGWAKPQRDLLRWRNFSLRSGLSTHSKVPQKTITSL